MSRFISDRAYKFADHAAYSFWYSLGLMRGQTDVVLSCVIGLYLLMADFVAGDFSFWTIIMCLFIISNNHTVMKEMNLSNEERTERLIERRNHIIPRIMTSIFTLMLVVIWALLLYDMPRIPMPDWVILWVLKFSFFYLWFIMTLSIDPFEYEDYVDKPEPKQAKVKA